MEGEYQESTGMIKKDLKISKMLKMYPETLDVLLKASPHFKKLNNAFLRKSLAGRVNVEQVARIAGVSLNDLLMKLNNATGTFEQTELFKRGENKKMKKADAHNDIQNFSDELPKRNIIELDVRPIINSGRDPFKDIMGKAKSLGENEVLMIINNFEPVPLYSVLAKKGFAHKTTNELGEWRIYFYKDSNPAAPEADVEIKKPEFNEEIFELNVRDLEPPEPMIRILETLPKLSDNTILLVHHHREPLMLYDKLAERGYSAITNKIEDNYYKVVITKLKES